MYTVQPFCKLCIFVAVYALCALYRVFTGDNTLFILAVPFSIWLWLYFRHFKIIITPTAVIKQSGNMFKRRQAVTRKNITGISTVKFLPFLPALIKLYYPSESITIIGLNGNQVSAVERLLAENFKP